MFSSTVGLFVGVMWTAAADPLQPTPLPVIQQGMPPSPVVPTPPNLKEVDPVPFDRNLNIPPMKYYLPGREPVRSCPTMPAVTGGVPVLCDPNRRPQAYNPPWYSFEMLPEVTPVPDATNSRQESATGNPGLRHRRFDFPNAAHFPQIQFDQQGRRIDVPGVVIYEGMRFAIDQAKSSSYQVTFTVTIPERPVTLHLQLSVETAGGVIPLTLPPIYLEPKVNDTLRRQENTFQVRVNGNSTLLSDHLAEVQDALNCNQVFRTGTVRFSNYRRDPLLP